MPTSSLRAAALALVLLSSIGLAGCAAAGTTGSDGGATQAPAAPEAPADLTGDWKQTNSKSEDTYQAATIAGDTITIWWVSDNGDTKSLYWAGTFEAPTEPGEYSWESENDTSQTDSALLASGDPTKTFKFDGNGEISYEASALGTTVTVRLARE
ncbi:MAG TPA: hypothetical protein VL294_12185 [Pseudolysinimonas sp.]|jgi:hypothetical protein|nr:hypothetical protein [Pseudolysinimonas sp.]